MASIQRFLKYAEAFEQSLASDDWSPLEEFFTQDAVYQLTGDSALEAQIEGRAEILAYLRDSVNGLDRRFDNRTLSLRGDPTLDGETVTIQWTASYHKAGAPDLVMQGTEHATFEGHAIRVLQDVFEAGTAEAVAQHMETYFS